MTDPTPDDDDPGVGPSVAEDGDGSLGGAPVGADAGATPAPARPDTAADPAADDVAASKPSDPQADVAARRAATTARMEREREVKGRTTTKAPMAKASAADPTGTRARRQQAAAASRIPKPSKRTGGVDPKAARATAARSGNPRKAAEAAAAKRYTAPVPRAQLESPTWVPALAFTLLGGGAVMVLLTYVFWEGRPATLGIGLALILGGILTLTQYR